MLKGLGAALGFTLLFSGSAYSQSLPEPATETVDFVCYIETANGQVVDLTKVCDTGRIRIPSAPAATAAPVAPGRASSALSPETNLGGLNIGGQNGSPLCFGVDAQGRACPYTPVTQE
jgi:hypothetical protein